MLQLECFGLSRTRIVTSLIWATSTRTLKLTPSLRPAHRPLTPRKRHIALPFRAIRIGRALWFGGKYALVGFEISVLAASICVLRGGPRAVPRAAEIGFFLTSMAIGSAAFVWFIVRAGHAEDSGFNDADQTEASTGMWVHSMLVGGEATGVPSLWMLLRKTTDDNHHVP